MLELFGLQHPRGGHQISQRDPAHRRASRASIAGFEVLIVPPLAEHR